MTEPAPSEHAEFHDAIATVIRFARINSSTVRLHAHSTKGQRALVIVTLDENLIRVLECAFDMASGQQPDRIFKGSMTA